MTLWTPDWRIKVNGTELTSVILSNLTITSGRQDINSPTPAAVPRCSGCSHAAPPENQGTLPCLPQAVQSAGAHTAVTVSSHPKILPNTTRHRCLSHSLPSRDKHHPPFNYHTHCRTTRRRKQQHITAFRQFDNLTVTL